jgi:hypothetical protein
MLSVWTRVAERLDLPPKWQEYHELVALAKPARQPGPAENGALPGLTLREALVL